MIATKPAIAVTLALTVQEYGQLAAKVERHNTEGRADSIADGEGAWIDQTVESYLVDLIRDEIGLDPLDEPRTAAPETTS